MSALIVWDMDGTLVDTREGITRTINAIRQTKDLEPVSSDHLVRWINDEDVNLAQMFYGTPTYLPSDKAMFEEIYWEECSRNVTLFEGVFDVINELYRRGIRQSVATNAATLFAQKILKEVGLAPYFDWIVGADLADPKPDDAMLRWIQNRYNQEGIVTKMTMMVGDGIKDMKAARRYGTKAIYVSWGYSQLSEGTHDGVCHEAHDLLRYL